MSSTVFPAKLARAAIAFQMSSEFAAWVPGGSQEKPWKKCVLEAQSLILRSLILCSTSSLKGRHPGPTASGSGAFEKTWTREGSAELAPAQAEDPSAMRVRRKLAPA